MLISPPFPLKREPNESDADYIARCMPDTSIVVQHTSIPEGSFPVSFKLGWHGGMHLKAPEVARNNTNNTNSTNSTNRSNVMEVCAIADGEVVYVRQPTPRSSSNVKRKEALEYDPYRENNKTWTDDGCVILKHSSMGIVFYSLYMHLKGIINPANAPLAKGVQVTRHLPLGNAGYIYGADGQLHFEIFCDDENAKKLVGRKSGVLNTAADGRSDMILGEIYYRLPVGTQVYEKQPPHNVTTPTDNAVVHTLTEPIIIGITYSERVDYYANEFPSWIKKTASSPVSGYGNTYIAAYGLAGRILAAPVIEIGAHYALRERVETICSSYPANARPKPEAVYQMLRFGRTIAPETLTPANVPNWTPVSLPSGRGWINLNTSGVLKFSDADFPPWKLWRMIDDDMNGDSRCDSDTIKKIICNPLTNSLNRPGFRGGRLV